MPREREVAASPTVENRSLRQPAQYVVKTLLISFKLHLSAQPARKPLLLERRTTVSCGRLSCTAGHTDRLRSLAAGSEWSDQRIKLTTSMVQNICYIEG